MKIATWNVNSLKARLPIVLDWLGSAGADVVCLQEIKCQTEAFPLPELTAAGWQCLVLGQKSYNGVALLSRAPIADPLIGLPGDDSDDQARYVEATVQGIRIASLYLPNGNPVEGPKYPYKLAWMRRLADRARQLLASERPVVLAGDYNVCPTDLDVYDPAGWRLDALCRAETRAAWHRLVHQGWTDAVRTLRPDEPHLYSFWDYQAGCWPRDDGLRIDHLLLSPQAADRLTAVGIDREPRGRDKASDHTPVWCDLA